MNFKRKNKKQDDEIVNAILGAAVMSAMAEPKKKEVSPLERAEQLHTQYEAFIEVGFTEEQATQFIAAILH